MRGRPPRRRLDASTGGRRAPSVHHPRRGGRFGDTGGPVWSISGHRATWVRSLGGVGEARLSAVRLWRADPGRAVTCDARNRQRGGEPCYGLGPGPGLPPASATWGTCSGAASPAGASDQGRTSSRPRLMGKGKGESRGGWYRSWGRTCSVAPAKLGPLAVVSCRPKRWQQGTGKSGGSGPCLAPRLARLRSR